MVMVTDEEKPISKAESIELLEKADVVLVFDPPWNSEMMTEEAKLELGLF